MAAADAYASGQSVGLGGWWLPDGLPLHPANIQWFSISLRQEDLPKWFTEEAQDLQSLSAASAAGASPVFLMGLGEWDGAPCGKGATTLGWSAPPAKVCP